MPSIFDDLHDFHTKVLLLEQPPPRLIDPTFALERVRFMHEELSEFLTAALEHDLIKAVDGLLDIIYVAGGTLWFMGVPSQECWDAVQKANMAKVRGTTSRGNKIDAAKPPGWVSPEPAIACAIEEAIDRFNNASDSKDPE